MHLYNLPILKVPQHVLNAVSSLRKYRNVKRPQSASIQNSLYYNCCIISVDTFYVRKLDLNTGEIQQKQVKVQNNTLTGIFLCKDCLILTTDTNQISYIQVESIFKLHKSSQIIFLEKDFDYFSSSQIFGYYSCNTLKFMIIGNDLIMVHLQEHKIVFQKLAQSSKKKWVISSWDLGYGRNDKLVNFEVKNQILFESDSQKQLILGVIKILQQNGDQVYLFLEMLWNQSRYVSSQIYIYKSNAREYNQKSKIHFVTFSSLFNLVYTGQHLIICKRLTEGIQVQGIIPIYHQILDMISIESLSNDPQILTVSKSEDRTKIYKHNLNEILNNLIIQPKVIDCDSSSISGELVGFIKLPSQNPLLVFSAQTYILMPTILSLYKRISNIYVSTQLEQNEYENQQFLQQKINQNGFQFLSFRSFYGMINKTKKRQIEQELNELFSAKKINKAVSLFQYTLQKQVKCFKNDTSICWKALLREYTYVFIYLLKFLNYLEVQIVQNIPVIVLSDCYLFQTQNAFNKLYNQRPLVLQPKIQSLIHKKIIQMKENLLSILNLFSKQSENLTIKNSKYQYFQIIKNLTKSQIVEFVTDKTLLVDYLAFFIYQAALTGNSQQWNKGRSLLRKILDIRKDYPPMIGLLCGDINCYTRNYQQLEFCRLLTIQQQKERRELQNLPYLKQISVAAPCYLKQRGLLHLLCFTPDEYEKHKYDGNFIVINIPKSFSNTTFDLIKHETIQIREKIYLLLTQENITKAMECMQSGINVDCCMESRCQIYIFSQRLKILSQVFVLQLSKCFDLKKLDRQKTYNRKGKYDCRCFSNQQYQRFIKPKKFNIKDRKFQVSKKQEDHNQVSIVQGFYSNLLQICEHFSLHKFTSYLKYNILKKSSSISASDNLGILDISKISYNENNNSSEESNNQALYNILFINMWNLYERIIYYQQTRFIDFTEQLELSSFALSYLSILQFLAVLVEPGYNKQISKLYENNQIQVLTLQRIKKALLTKTNHIQFKNSPYLTKFKQCILLHLVRMELLLKLVNLTGQWLYDFQQLLFQASLSQLKLSYRSQVVLSTLTEIVKN